MFNFMFALVIFLGLCFLLYVSVIAGRRYGLNQLERHKLGKLEVVSVIEGAVFALLGLLVAFTFTGAFDRFENRKQHIIDEANAVETAYLRLDMLKPAATTELRQHFREYIDTRLAVYKSIPDFKAVYRQLDESIVLQERIWKEVLAACKITNDQTVTQLVVPAINEMFDAEKMGYALTRIHPPIVIFFLLIGLALLSSFMAGYVSVEIKNPRSIYILIYIVITAIILYLIIDLELPRMGLLRVDFFDQFLMDVRQQMN